MDLTFNAAESALRSVRDLKRNADLLIHQREFVDSSPFLLFPSSRRAFRLISSDYHELGRTKREFDYKSIVISLYGIMESFVESIIDEYIRELADICIVFSKFPIAIRSKHQELCVRLSSRLIQSSEIADITISQVLKGAYEAEALDLASSIVSEAFASHTANVRTQVVDILFSNIGIERLSSRVAQSPPFIDICTRSAYKAEIVLGADGRFFHLDDLCLQRNSVAHGRVVNIISLDVMFPFLTFVGAFCAGIDFVLRQELNRERIERTGRDLGDNISVFPKVRSIGFPVLAETLAAGVQVGRSSSARGGRYDLCRVDEIRVGGLGVAVAEQGEKNVTIKLTPFLAGRAKYFSLP